MYVELEAAASQLRVYDPELVPGLLRTPSYTRSLFSDSGVEQSDEVIESFVKLRQERRETVTVRTPPLALTVILGPGVLARRVGSEQVMAEQIELLIETNRLDHAHIRVSRRPGVAVSRPAARDRRDRRAASRTRPTGEATAAR